MEAKTNPYKLTLIKFKNSNILSTDDQYISGTDYKIQLQKNDNIELNHYIFLGNYEKNDEIRDILIKISKDMSYQNITKDEKLKLDDYVGIDFTKAYPLENYNTVTFIPSYITDSTNIKFLKEKISYFLDIIPSNQFLFCFNIYDDFILENFQKKNFENKELLSLLEIDTSSTTYDEFITNEDITNKLKKYIFTTSICHEFQTQNKKLFLDIRFENMSEFNLNIDILDYKITQSHKNLYTIDNIENSEIFLYDLQNLLILKESPNYTGFNWDIFTQIYFPFSNKESYIDKQSTKLKINEQNNIDELLSLKEDSDFYLQESINTLTLKYDLPFSCKNIDLLEIFNMVDLNKDLPFVKYYSTITGDDIYKIYKSEDISMIEKDLLTNWIKFNDYKYDNYTLFPTKKKYELIYKAFITKTKTENMISGVVINILEEKGKKFFTVITDNNDKLIVDEDNVENTNISTLKINDLINFFEYSDNYLHISFTKNSIKFTVLNNICGNNVQSKISETINDFLSKIQLVLDKNISQIPKDNLTFFENKIYQFSENYIMTMINSTICLSVQNKIFLDKLTISQIFRYFNSLFTVDYEDLYDSDNNKYFDVEYFDGMRWISATILKKLNEFTYEIQTKGSSNKTVNEINLKKKDSVKRFYRILYKPNNNVEIKFKKTSKRSKSQNIYITNVSSTREYLLIKNTILTILHLYHNHKDILQKYFDSDSDKNEEESDTTLKKNIGSETDLLSKSDYDDLWDSSSDEEEDRKEDLLTDVADGNETQSSDEEIEIDILENEEQAYYDNFEDNSVLNRLYKYEPLFSDSEINYPRLVQGESQPKILTDVEKKERYSQNVNDCISIINKKKQLTEHFCIECSKSKIFVKGKNDTYFCKLLKFNNNWFLCPNVWDFKENVAIEENDLLFLPLGSFLSSIDIPESTRKRIGIDLYGKNYKQTSFINRHIQLKSKTIEQLEFYIEFFLDSTILSNHKSFDDDLYKYLLIFIITSKEFSVQNQKPNRSDGIQKTLKQLLNLSNEELISIVKLSKYKITGDIFEQFQLSIDKDYFNQFSLKNDDVIWRHHVQHKKNKININKYGLNSEQISFIKEYVDLSNENIDILEFSPRTLDNRTFYKGKLNSNERSLYFNKKNLLYPQFHKSKLPNCAKMAHNNLDKYYELDYNTEFETGRYLKNEENKLDNQRLSLLTSDILINFFSGLKCSAGQIKDAECFFRKGVDDINNNSFFYAIVDIINTFNKGKKNLIYIHDLINFLLTNIDYDLFSSMNYGNLELLFRNRLGRQLPEDSLQNYFEYIVSDQFKKHEYFIDFFSSEKFINTFFSPKGFRLMILIIEKKPDNSFIIHYPFKKIKFPNKFIFILKIDNSYEPIYYTSANEVEHISVIDKFTNKLFEKNIISRLKKGHQKVLANTLSIYNKSTNIHIDDLLYNDKIQKHFNIEKLYINTDNYNKITFVVLKINKANKYLIVPVDPYPYLLLDTNDIKERFILTDKSDLDKYKLSKEDTIAEFNTLLSLLNKPDLNKLENNDRLHKYNESDEIIALKLSSKSEIPIIPISGASTRKDKKYSDEIINQKLIAYQEFSNHFKYFKNSSEYNTVKEIFSNIQEKYIDDTTNYLVVKYKNSKICIRLTDKTDDFLSLDTTKDGLTQIITDSENDNETNIKIVINYIDNCNELSTQYENIINIRPYRFLLDNNKIISVCLENNTNILLKYPIDITTRKNYNYLLSYINYQFNLNIYDTINSHYEINNYFIDERITSIKSIKYKEIIYKLFKKTTQSYIHKDSNQNILINIKELLNTKKKYIDKFKDLYNILNPVFDKLTNNINMNKSDTYHAITKINLDNLDKTCLEKSKCSDNCTYNEVLQTCKMDIISSDEEKPDFYTILKFYIVSSIIRNKIIQKDFIENMDLTANKSEFIPKKDEIIFRETDMNVDFINNLYVKKYDFYRNYGLFDLSKQSIDNLIDLGKAKSNQDITPVFEKSIANKQHKLFRKKYVKGTYPSLSKDEIEKIQKRKSK